MSFLWNPWHGCHKLSAGCQNCYVYRIDQQHGKNSGEVLKTSSFRLPSERKRDGSYRIPSGERVYTCLSSDFFLEDADIWRQDAWSLIKERTDLSFYIITKRIHRLEDCLPCDWETGYENVTVCCTVENQDRADFRLPIFYRAPIRHKEIICEPLLEKLDLSPYLGKWVERVTVGGESGPGARPCDFDWVLKLREQCVRLGIPFHFKQTGALFLKNGKQYRIPRSQQQEQAQKAGIDFNGNVDRAAFPRW